jgi:hypothetical protein
MSRDDKLELVGRFWDSLSTGQRLFLLSIGTGAIGAAFWAGYATSQKYYENKIASIEAKNDRALLALEREKEEATTKSQRLLSDLQTKTTPIIGQISFFVPGEESVPKLADAEECKLTMAEFANIRPQESAAYMEKTGHLTALQKPKYVDKYSNKSFTWTGYVSEVGVQGSSKGPEYSVSLRLDPQKTDSFEVSCVFAGKAYEEMMKALVKNQKITVRGVLAESGRLVDCRLVRSDPPTASAGPS